jgi:hypothetical protein
MKCNVGSIDRVIRLVIGIGIAVAGIIFNSYWGLIGLIPIATGLFSFCPLYAPFKINTGKKEA